MQVLPEANPSLRAAMRSIYRVCRMASSKRGHRGADAHVPTFLLVSRAHCRHAPALPLLRVALADAFVPLLAIPDPSRVCIALHLPP